MKRKWYLSHFFKALAVSALAVFVYHFWLAKLDLFQYLQFKAKDSVAKIAYHHHATQHRADELVLVTIDNEDFSKVRKWPWPRKLFADFLRKLTAYRPKAVFFDIVFHGSSPSGPEDDAAFESALKEAGNVILSSFIDKEWNYQIPYEKFAAACYAYGFVNKPRDLDLVVRRGRVIVFGPEHTVVDLCAEVKVVCKYLDIPLEETYLHEEGIELRRGDDPSVWIPIGGDGTIPINYTVSREDIVTVPFWRILKGELPPERLKDKIVFISITSEAFHDQFNTPTHEDQPGAVIGANILAMILKNRFLAEPPAWAVWGFSFAAAFAVCFMTLRFPFLVGLLFMMLAGAAIYGGAIYLRLRLFDVDLFSPLFVAGAVFVGDTVYNYIRLMIRNAGLRQLAITDGLTGMYIYRYLVVRMKSEVERAQRYGMELTFIISDIDHFRNFNNTYGHEIGNVVLKNVARIIRENCRKTDFAARYGGEEFCVLLPHTPFDKGVQLAEKLRKAVEAFSFPGPEGPLKVTSSFGVSTFVAGQVDTVKKLFTSADAALYRAKETGRNRVCGFDLSQDKMPEEGGEMEGADFPIPLD